jgi:hypothetical protein
VALPKVSDLLAVITCHSVVTVVSICLVIGWNRLLEGIGQRVGVEVPVATPDPSPTGTDLGIARTDDSNLTAPNLNANGGDHSPADPLRSRAPRESFAKVSKLNQFEKKLVNPAATTTNTTATTTAPLAANVDTTEIAANLANSPTINYSRSESNKNGWATSGKGLNGIRQSPEIETIQELELGAESAAAAPSTKAMLSRQPTAQLSQGTVISEGSQTQPVATMKPSAIKASKESEEDKMSVSSFEDDFDDHSHEGDSPNGEHKRSNRKQDGRVRAHSSEDAGARGNVRPTLVNHAMSLRLPERTSGTSSSPTTTPTGLVPTTSMRKVSFGVAASSNAEEAPLSNRRPSRSSGRNSEFHYICKV